MRRRHTARCTLFLVCQKDDKFDRGAEISAAMKPFIPPPFRHMSLFGQFLCKTKLPPAPKHPKPLDLPVPLLLRGQAPLNDPRAVLTAAYGANLPAP